MFMRRVSQLAVQTAKRSVSIVRVARPVQKVCFNAIGNARFFSQEVEQSLSEVLAAELEEEVAGNEEIDGDFVDIKTQIAKNFKIKDEEGSCVITLTSTHENENIEITFNVQDEEETEPDFEEEEEEVEEEEEHGSAIRFEVSVSKKNSKDKVIYFCLAGESVSIQNVQYLPAGKTVDDKTVYDGPVFGMLSDDLQESLLQYLADRNIDDDMAFFINKYSSNKEQREYVNWLKKLMIFQDAK